MVRQIFLQNSPLLNVIKIGLSVLEFFMCAVEDDQDLRHSASLYHILDDRCLDTG
jgi:hypothetical protein